MEHSVGGISSGKASLPEETNVENKLGLKDRELREIIRKVEETVTSIELLMPKNTYLGKLHGYVLDAVNTVFEVLSIKTVVLTPRDKTKKKELEAIEKVYKQIKAGTKNANEVGRGSLALGLKELSNYAAKMSGDRVDKSLITEAIRDVPNFKLAKKMMEEKLAERDTKFHSGHMMLLKNILSQDKYANTENINKDELRFEIHEAILPSTEKIAERIENLSKFKLESYGTGRDFLDSIGGVTFSWAGYLTERDKLKLNQHEKIKNLLSDIRLGRNFGNEPTEELKKLYLFTQISKGERVDRVRMDEAIKKDPRLGIVKKLVEKEFDHELPYSYFGKIKEIISKTEYKDQISEMQLRNDLSNVENMTDRFKGSRKNIQTLDALGRTEDKILWKKTV